MQELEQALKEARSLHQEVLGRPAPELGAHTYLPFQPGVDPIRQALFDVEQLKKDAERSVFAPRQGAWLPAADTFSTKDDYVVRLEVPGVSREDLKVLVLGDECVVRGERKPPHDFGDVRPLAVERAWGPFERRFALPAGSRPDEMKARLADGVLELTVPTADGGRPVEHEVEVS